MKRSNLKHVLASASLLTGLMLFSTASTADTAACDADAGRKAFNKCASCHSLTQGTHMMGPSLNGVVDRKTGSAEGFVYSIAMEQVSYNWTPEKLDGFLKKPMAYLPGTSMPFGGLKKDEDRANLICFLAQQ